MDVGYIYILRVLGDEYKIGYSKHKPSIKGLVFVLETERRTAHKIEYELRALYNQYTLPKGRKYYTLSDVILDEVERHIVRVCNVTYVVTFYP